MPDNSLKNILFAVCWPYPSRIGAVYLPYKVRIHSVSHPYHTRITPVSSPYPRFKQNQVWVAPQWDRLLQKNIKITRKNIHQDTVKSMQPGVDFLKSGGICKKTRKPIKHYLRSFFYYSAEGKGFEPLIGFLLYTLSRRASSTTPAPLLKGSKNTV